MQPSPFRHLPGILHPDQFSAAIRVLEKYFAPAGAGSVPAFTGSRFDSWDPSETREKSSNRFTSDDLVALSLLSVEVPGRAAIRLLESDAARFTKLLENVGPDDDLVNRTQPFADDGAEWQLWSALTGLKDVGPTTASKLYARKRPRMRPIYDRVIADVLGSKRIWEPLRATLVGCAWLQPHLQSLHQEAGLGAAVPALRVFDVLVWMAGKGEVETSEQFDPLDVHVP